MALVGHDNLNSRKIYFVLTTFVLNTEKNDKNNSKKLKKTRQSSKTDISDIKLECAKMFLMKFC